MNTRFNISILLIFCVFLNFKIQINALGDGETCGRVQIGRGNIIGGKYANRGAFPWVAVLMNDDGLAFCGGTLLTKNKVLTAAHCTHGKDEQYKFLPNDITVMLGAHNLSVAHERGKISVGVQSIENHLDWNTKSASFDADISMLTLTDDVPFNRYIQPICLIDPDSGVENIWEGYSVGYGKSEDESKMHENVLKFVKTPIHNSNEVCFYSNHALLKLSSTRTFCGGSRDGAGVCLGDSGNGLFVKQGDTFYLRGIVSASLWTDENCDVHNYAIFTNVLKFRAWIDEKINSHSNGYTYNTLPTTSRKTTPKPTTTTSKTTTRMTTTRTTQRMKSQELEPWIVPCGEAKVVVQSILGGTTVQKGTHPWIAALIDKTEGYFCGGTLISKRLVVTAAHCVSRKGSVERMPADLTVLLGVHQLDNPNETGRRSYGVESIELHNNWNPNVEKFDSDIAILKLSVDVTFDTFIQPICVAKAGAPFKNFNEGVIVGFGKSESSGSHENVPKKANTPIRSSWDCYAEFPNLLNIASYRTFCGGFANGTGSCTGDSGGGLTVVQDDVHYLRGIVSASLHGTEYGCDVNSYSIFTDLRFYLPFIKKV